jgi:hypothetical protein
MHVVMAAGHRLAQKSELRVADILDQPFAGGPRLDPRWRAFWTLDEQARGPSNVDRGPRREPRGDRHGGRCRSRNGRSNGPEAPVQDCRFAKGSSP